MHFDQNILFIIIVAIVGISRLIARIVENAREQAQRTRKPRASQQVPSRPVSTSREKSDEQRVREFLEALGQAPGAKPPPPITPRTNIPPRPLVPVQPPPSMRPFSPVVLKQPRQKRTRVFPPPIPKTIRPPTSLPATNQPGAWIEEEEKIREAAVKFQAATERAGVEDQVVSHIIGPNWKQMLHSTASLRTAIVLREIFGPPRGLHPLDFAI